MNTIFLQFYCHYSTYTGLSNGFSETYEYCKNIGEFLWVDEEDIPTFQIPISSGTVYISALFLKHLRATLKWANENPNVNFVAGGPAVLTSFNISNDLIPSNLELTTKTVEQYFSISDFSLTWGIELDNIPNVNTIDKILFSYTLDTECYWKKCIFCDYILVENRKRPLIDFSGVYSLNFPNKIHVRLNTPSLRLSYIDQFFDAVEYNDNIRYDFFMRCDRALYNRLDERLKSFDGPVPKIKFRLGIEFPTERMLSHMKKGFTVQDILNTISILSQYENIEILIMSIIGWKTLVEDDILELQNFINQIPENSIDTNIIFRACYFLNTEWHETYNGEIQQHIYDGNFYRGYFPLLSDEETRLNKIAGNMIKDIPSKKSYVNPQILDLLNS